MSPLSRSQLERYRHERPGGRQGRGQPPSRARWLALFVVFTVAMAAAVALDVASLGTGVRVYVVVVVAVVALAAMRSVLFPLGRIESRPRRRRRTAVEAGLPPFFERARQRVELASTFAVHFDLLRRDLREIAGQRLAGHGLRLGDEGARRLLGEGAWLLLERPLEGDKFGPGPPLAELERLLVALEAI